MGRKLYVGNISVSVDKFEIRQLFSAVGTVETINVVSDQIGKPRGAFVEMATDAEAAHAIAELDQAEIDGRRITVDDAVGPEAIQDESRFVTAFAV